MAVLSKATLGASTSAVMRRPPMPLDRALACRLAKAAAVAYVMDQPGGVTASPWYADVGFTDAPDVVISGADRIDGGLVGRNTDGVIVAFRGTLPLTLDSGSAALFQSLFDWLNDAKTAQVPGYGGMVHGGFADSLDHLWPALRPKIEARAVDGTRIFMTGHSKGGALAVLAAIRLHDESRLSPAAVYTYAAPRAGNRAFVDHYGRAIAEHWRFENRDDLIPHLPPSAALWQLLRRLDPRFTRVVPFEYAAVGTLQFIDWGGLIVTESFALEIQRGESLAEKLITGQLGTIPADHELTGGYFAVVCT